MGVQDSDNQDESDSDALIIHFRKEELVIQRRYQALSVANDFLIGIWFLIGSIAFFSPAWQEFGTWLFVIGSAELLIRPAIRLAHRLHLRPLPAGQGWDL